MADWKKLYDLSDAEIDRLVLEEVFRTDVPSGFDVPGFSNSVEIAFQAMLKAAEETKWWEATRRPNGACVNTVGDPKQNVYDEKPARAMCIAAIVGVRWARGSYEI